MGQPEEREHRDWMTIHPNLSDVTPVFVPDLPYKKAGIHWIPAFLCNLLQTQQVIPKCVEISVGIAGDIHAVLVLQIQKPDPKAFLKFSFSTPKTPPSFGHRVLESTVNPLLGGGAKEET